MQRAMICPMVTAFTAQGKIDERANAAQIERLIAGGVGGILFLGSIGEFSAMSMKSKHVFLRFAISQVAHRTRVLFGATCSSVEETLAFTEVGREAGADAAMILPPDYFPATLDEVIAYYSQLAEQTGLSFMMYNFPATTGTSIEPETAASHAKAFPQIIGIKDTVDCISHTRALIAKIRPLRPDFEIYSGFDEYGLLNLMLGGNGVISGMNNLAPELFKRLLMAVHQRNYAEAEAAQRRICQLMPLYQAMPSFVQAIKLAVGFFVKDYPEQMALCCPPAKAEQRKTIEGILIRSGLLNT